MVLAQDHWTIMAEVTMEAIMEVIHIMVIDIHQVVITMVMIVIIAIIITVIVTILMIDIAAIINDHLKNCIQYFF